MKLCQKMRLELEVEEKVSLAGEANRFTRRKPRVYQNLHFVFTWKHHLDLQHFCLKLYQIMIGASR